MPIALDVADTLVAELGRQRSLTPAAAAERLLALACGPPELARALLDAVVDEDARLAWCGGEIALAGAPWGNAPFMEASFAVVDLETTGLDAGRDEITEAAVVVVERGRIARRVELIVTARRPPEAVADRVLSLAGDSVVAGHNVAFDLRFLGTALARARSARPGAAVVDTLVLSRRLLGGRTEQHSLAALATFFGTPSEPCHRALPDATAAAEILACLLEVAAERGLSTVGDLCAWSRPASKPVRSGTGRSSR